MDFPQQLLFPQKTILKPGAAAQIIPEAMEFGLHGVIVHGQSLVHNGALEKILTSGKPHATIQTFCRNLGSPRGEPMLDEISHVIGLAKSINANWIVGVGGGSVIDLAKAAAGLFNARQKPVYYQDGGKLESLGIPFIAVPTTSGTGAEATPNAVIINPALKAKLSIRDESFLARKVILDVELLKGLPPPIIAYSGMDALVQAYESYISKNATWFSENLSLKAIGLIHQNLLLAYQTRSEESLSGMLLASYLGGIALASARLGVIHGLAHPLGALYDLPHGLICAVCLIPSIDLNKTAMGKKYELMSQTVEMDFRDRVKQWLSGLNITSPFEGREIIGQEKIIAETLSSGSTAANPKPIKADDVNWLLKNIFV